MLVQSMGGSCLKQPTLKSILMANVFFEDSDELPTRSFYKVQTVERLKLTNLSMAYCFGGINKQLRSRSDAVERGV